jgi:DNA recombination protein RmuC
MDIVVGISVGVLLGGAIAYVIAQRAIARARDESRGTFGALEASRQEVKGLREQLAQQQSMEEVMKNTFKAVANEGLVEQGKRITELHQKELDDTLRPLKEKLAEFQDTVRTGQQESFKTHTQLIEQIKSLSDLNRTVSEEAGNLTRALKGESKTQGNWGELVLERVLEASGLEKGLTYRTQTSTQNQDGATIRPDVVVELPDDKHIIIDAKVSLTAYEEFISADEGSSEREIALKRHIDSVRNHVKLLASKEYHTAAGLTPPEFTLMFVPIESTFAITLKTDSDMFDHAWKHRIVIVSPTTLLATLKTIASLWKIEKQNRHAITIAESAGKLYDKFVGFVNDLQDVQTKLQSTERSLDSAMNKLTTGRGNLVKRAEDLRALGVKAQKNLPPELLDAGDDE